MSTTNTHGFEDRLLAELRPLVDERSVLPRRRNVSPLRRAAALVVLTMVSAGILALALARRDGGDQVLAEELDDGRVRVTLDLAEYFDAPDAARDELEQAGLDVVVERPAGSPSMVDKVTNIMVDHDAPGVEVAEGVRDPDEVASATIDPEAFNGQITLVVPRAPKAGEPLEIAGPAFFEGEPLEGLWCEQWPLTAQQIADAAAGRGLEVSWEVITSVTPNARHPEYSDFGVEHSAEQPDGRVVMASLATNALYQPVTPPAGSLSVLVLPDDVESRPDVERGLTPDSMARHCAG